MITHKELAAAATECDESSEQGGIEALAESFDIKLPDLVHVCQQRALRLRLLATGRLGEISTTSPVAIPLSREDQAAINNYTVGMMDAMTIGIVATSKIMSERLQQQAWDLNDE